MTAVGAPVHAHPMNPETAVDRLRTAAAIGGQDYWDRLATTSVELCQRPGDWIRVAQALDHAIRHE